MFRRNLIPVWTGILLVSGMLLMGQQDPCLTIQGAWQGPVVQEGITVGELGIIMTISYGPNWPCGENEVTGTVMGLPIEDGQWKEVTRQITGHINMPDSGSPLVFDCILGSTEGQLVCDYTFEGYSGEVDAGKVNDSPENPDPSTPVFDYMRSYPFPGQTGVPLRPVIKLAWSKPMSPYWDISLVGLGEYCVSLHGGHFTHTDYLFGENAFILELNGLWELSPLCFYRLEVQTCGEPDGFRDPFGVYAECPWPMFNFTTGGP